MLGYLLRHPKSQVFAALFYSFIIYVLFFYKVFTPNFGFWGSDMVTQYYPVRVYLRDAVLNDHTFPFWSEKIFSGFPMHADMENSYLNPINVLSILLLGPMLSYKFLHLATYLIGSLFFYLLLKRKGVNLLGFMVANTAFYFGFFMLNHQVHLSIMMIAYITPLHFYLLDKFIYDNKLKYIVFQALAMANIIYWGHIQFVLIMILGLGVYALSHLNLLKIKKLLLYFVITGVLSFVFSAPLLVSNFELFKDGYRDGGVSALQGSLMPNASLVTIYPFLFKTWNNFIGPNIGYRFTYTEMYIYIGISLFSLSLLSFIFQKRDPIYYFGYFTLWLFIVLSMMQFEKFIYLDKLPLISLFRYWVRSVFILSFALSLLVGRFVSMVEFEFNIKKILTGFGLMILPFIYLYTLFLVNQTPEVIGMTEYLKTPLSKIDPQNFKYWIFFFIATLVLGIFHLWLNFRKKIIWAYGASILLVFLVLGDLYFFSKDVTNNRILSIKESDRSVKVPEYFHNRRAIVRSGLVGNQYLFIDSWSPFGYSNFVKNDYMSLLLESNIDNYKHIINRTSKNYQDVKDYRKLGIISSYQPKDNPLDTILIDLDTAPVSDLIKSYDGNVSELSRSEYGKFSFNFSSQKSGEVATFIKSDNGFRLFINGKDETSTLDKSDVFMRFNLPSGNHLVEIIYVPTDFYLGVFITLFGSFSLLIFWKKINSFI